MKIQGRRVMPKIRSHAKHTVSPPQLTFGDLVAAAFDTLDCADSVTYVLSSHRISDRIGRKLVFI